MKKLAYISGGIGGAKLAKGFYAQKNIDLSIIVNTGDDEIIHGVKLSPDVGFCHVCSRQYGRRIWVGAKRRYFQCQRLF
jgi:hypothetical protein